ncbi:hypothetical protein ACLB2K_019601 [Fragaria x ananassa]
MGVRDDIANLLLPPSHHIESAVILKKSSTPFSQSLVDYVWHAISSSKLATGCMFNSSEELVVLKKIGVQCRPCSNKVGYGGVFRDYSGKVLGVFCSNLDIPSSVAAEVMDVIKAIELAWVREWKHIWLEVDSELVLSFLRSPTLVPWQLSVEWNNCLYRISQMNFHSSHIFRESNKVADALANEGIKFSGLTW